MTIQLIEIEGVYYVETGNKGVGDLIREATPEEIAEHLGAKPIEKFNPDEAYKTHKETTWNGPMPPAPAITDARIAEIREQVKSYSREPWLRQDCIDLLAALDAATAYSSDLEDDRDALLMSAKSQRARAIAAEAERDQMRAALKPFAMAADKITDPHSIVFDGGAMRSDCVFAEDFYAARAAIAQEPS